MKASFLVFVSCVTLAALCLSAHAQKQGTIPRIGIVRAGAPPVGAAPDLFVEGLRGLGYIEGKNIFFEIRYAEGSRDRLREFATELVHLKVDAIFTASSPAMFALKEATKTIPIVIVSSSDPVGEGIVSSLAQPGGNITGMSLIATDLWPKRLELLKEIFPKAFQGRDGLEQK
jgi:putative ABC transport system substrate-binding protein